MAAAAGVDDGVRSDCRAAVTRLVSSKFKATLGSESDIVNIFMGLIYLESTFNPDSIGGILGSLGSGSRDFLNSSAAQSILSGTDPVAKANIQACNRAVGLCQVLGFYFIKNSSAKNGKNELERARPDLSDTLLLPAGSDVIAFVNGAENIEKILTAGLVILESKYKQAAPAGAMWKINGDRNGHVFSSKIAAAIGAYLGLGISDQLGTTPEAYAASIVGGQAYQIANGAAPITGSRRVQTGGAGPSTNGSGKTVITPAGC